MYRSNIWHLWLHFWILQERSKLKSADVGRFEMSSPRQGTLKFAETVIEISIFSRCLFKSKVGFCITIQPDFFVWTSSIKINNWNNRKNPKASPRLARRWIIYFNFHFFIKNINCIMICGKWLFLHSNRGKFLYGYWSPFYILIN
jgi:hypothetical protein